MFGIPLHQKISQPAQAMAGETRVEDRIAPIVIARVRRRARHLPARQRRARFHLRAIAQDKNGDAAFTCRESQAAAGHQIQAFGDAFHFQEYCARMRASQNVAGRR